MTIKPVESFFLKRCTLHYNHGGKHEAMIGTVRGTWESIDTAGYFEER